MKHQKGRIDIQIFGVENIAKIMADKKHTSVNNIAHKKTIFYVWIHDVIKFEKGVWGYSLI